MKTKEHWACEIQEPTIWTSFDAIAEAIQTDARADLLERIKSLEGELSSTKSHNAEMLSFARRFSSTCAVLPPPDWVHKTADKIVQGNPESGWKGHPDLLERIKSLEGELADLKRLLAEKNETANVFMNQVKKIQSTIKALEVELETAKQDRNREGTKQRAEYLPKLTQAHAALQTAMVAVDLTKTALARINPSTLDLSNYRVALGSTHEP